VSSFNQDEKASKHDRGTKAHWTSHGLVKVCRSADRTNQARGLASLKGIKVQLGREM